jgi:rare lipoprotein A
MKTNTDRPWRKYGLRLAPMLVAASFALSAATAHGETGGLSAATSEEASASNGIAFAPLRWAGATWYGPGFYGRRTACGEVLRPQTIGVAHRNLPCGTTIKLVYRGRAIVTNVIDRGPYSRGNAWDLTNGARRALGFGGSGRVGYAVAIQYARNSG